MLGDIASGPAFKITQWLELVRKRSSKHHASGFPRRPLRVDSMPPRLLLTLCYLVFTNMCIVMWNIVVIMVGLAFSAGESSEEWKGPASPEHTTEVNLWERLGKAATLDIESSLFSWDWLSSLHHTEHSSSTDQSEDEMNKALEVSNPLQLHMGHLIFIELNQISVSLLFMYFSMLPHRLSVLLHIGDCEFGGSCFLCPFQPTRDG